MEVRGGVKCETGVVVLMSYVVQWEKSLGFGKGEDGQQANKSPERGSGGDTGRKLETLERMRESK